ncbi:MAG: class I SAM-dependent methyltransferase [Planctomycetota bacterium]
MTDLTREPQYQNCVELRDAEGFAQLGLMSNQIWHDDPRRLLFVLARYKFVAKMFSGLENVLEVGCADGFGARVVRQEVGALTAVDFDTVFIEDARRHTTPRWPIVFKAHDILCSAVPGAFDGVYSLDVLEHIVPEREEDFLRNIVASLAPGGAVIIGTPTLQSQTYASAPSKAGHVNVKDGAGLRALLAGFFGNVFVFSMNDEVVHTGFQPMAHYLLALCCHPLAGAQE